MISSTPRTSASKSIRRRLMSDPHSSPLSARSQRFVESNRIIFIYIICSKNLNIINITQYAFFVIMPCRFDETLTTLTASEGESDDEEEETIMPEIVPPVVGENPEYVILQL